MASIASARGILSARDCRAHGRSAAPLIATRSGDVTWRRYLSWLTGDANLIGAMAQARLRSSFIYLANAVNDLRGNWIIVAVVLAPLVLASALCLLPDALNIQYSLVRTFEPGVTSVEFVEPVQMPYAPAMRTDPKPPFPTWMTTILHLLDGFITLVGVNLVVLCALRRMQDGAAAGASDRRGYRGLSRGGAPAGAFRMGERAPGAGDRGGSGTAGGAGRPRLCVAVFFAVRADFRRTAELVGAAVQPRPDARQFFPRRSADRGLSRVLVRLQLVGGRDVFRGQPAGRMGGVDNGRAVGLDFSWSICLRWPSSIRLSHSCSRRVCVCTRTSARLRPSR